MQNTINKYWRKKKDGLSFFKQKWIKWTNQRLPKKVTEFATKWNYKNVSSCVVTSSSRGRKQWTQIFLKSEKEFEKAQIVFFNGVQYFHRILTEDAQ